MSDQQRLLAAADMAYEALFCDGGHHKQWYLDQILRTLLADGYERWRKNAESAGLLWDTGIAP